MSAMATPPASATGGPSPNASKGKPDADASRFAGAWLAVGGSMFAVAWGGNEFTPLLVMYREVSKFSTVTVDVLLGAYVVGIVPALLAGGPLSDRYGRRPLMLPAAPLSLLGSLILAVGPDSSFLLALGRVFCGIALGLVMAVGTTWIKELSVREGKPDAGAGRASMSLTVGFLVGAGLAGALAQWGPWPTATTYVLHIALTLVTGAWLFGVPETRAVEPAGSRPKLRDDLRVPPIGHRRFLRVVVPLAPWVFGSVGSAYAVLPGLMRDHSGGMPIALSALVTALTLAFGVAAQLVGKVIDTRHSARASVIAMAFLAVGMGLAALATTVLSLPLVLVAACVLGVGYGLALVAGLSEVQRIAGPDDLAGLTAVYYAIAYTGFFIPAILAVLSKYVTYSALFTGGVAVAICCLIVVACAWRSHLPASSAPRPGVVAEV